MSAAAALATAVPHAAPATPHSGNGPTPKMRTAFRTMFVGSVTSLTYIGVRVSLAPASARAATRLQKRKASDSMTIWRYTAPSSTVRGSSFRRPISGSAYSHAAAVMGSEMARESHSDCLIARSARSWSSDPLKRETTLIVPLVSASERPNGMK
jgi:hypothetical protein